MRWSKTLSLLGVTSLAFFAACNGSDKGDFPFDGGYRDEDEVDIPDPNDDTGEDGGENGEGEDGGDSGDSGDTGSSITEQDYQDDPGDVIILDSDAAEDGVLTLDLEDESKDSNTEQEFYLVLVNVSESAMSYSLEYGASPEDEEDTGGAEEGEPRSRPAPQPKSTRVSAPTPYHDRVRAARNAGLLAPAAPPPGPPAPPLDEADVGVESRDFLVRDSLKEDSSYDYLYATLWAVGDNVAIWVENGVPIDWDYECDGKIDEHSDYGDTYGFDNCDLQTVADITDTNLIPNLTSYFGDYSDVNEDGLVNIVISAKLNSMPLTSEDEEVQESFIGSYADPEVDLSEYDPNENPSTNLQEVIFVFAPDPYGYYNSTAGRTIEEYTDVELLSQIARSIYRLISYNNHILLSETPDEATDEEAWVREGLASMAMDLTGFGSPLHEDAWDFMDATHLHSLVSDEDEGAIATESYGAQYLFFRWLVDTYGTEILAELVQTEMTGYENVEAAVAAVAESSSDTGGGEDGGSTDIKTLMEMWQVSMLTTGVTNDSDSELVSSEDYPPYAEAEFIDAPTDNPDKGDLYGANGYQMGINVRGENYYFEGGISDDPTENESNRVRLANSDHLTLASSSLFQGYIEAYAAQVVRLVAVPNDAAALRIISQGSSYRAVVIRWNDPEDDLDYVVDYPVSSRDADDILLPDFPDDGSPIYGLGEIIGESAATMVDPDGATSDGDVYDTARWVLDLSDRDASEEVNVAIWLDRHYSDENEGEAALEDPWLSVLPYSWIPHPTVEDTNSDACPDGQFFQFPKLMLEHLFYQVFLSSTSYDGAGGTSSSTSGTSFDACGEVSETEATCEVDWDNDSVLDEEEPMPETFLEQVQVMQCTLSGGSYTPADSSIFDDDERDDDENASYDRVHNVGGTSVEDGEGAYWQGELEGGQKYVIVVGAGEDVGAYELTIQEIDP